MAPNNLSDIIRRKAAEASYLLFGLSRKARESAYERFSQEFDPFLGWLREVVDRDITLRRIYFAYNRFHLSEEQGDVRRYSSQIFYKGTTLATLELLLTLDGTTTLRRTAKLFVDRAPELSGKLDGVDSAILEYRLEDDQLVRTDRYAGVVF